MTGGNFYIFFFNDTATTEIYTLSLHDALPICHDQTGLVIIGPPWSLAQAQSFILPGSEGDEVSYRSEEHTSELQSHSDLVCRLLLEKKNKLLPALLQRFLSTFTFFL